MEANDPIADVDYSARNSHMLPLLMPENSLRY